MENDKKKIWSQTGFEPLNVFVRMQVKISLHRRKFHKSMNRIGLD